jgi:hypothetical protein
MKVSFVLLPWAGTDSGYDVLPELLNSLVDLFKPRARILTEHFLSLSLFSK